HFAKGSRSTQQNGAAEQMNSKKLVALSKMWQSWNGHASVIEQTKENVEKKQASTYEEMEADCAEVSVLFY
ncbi:unnamed protein product, partial [Musa textilis]